MDIRDKKMHAGLMRLLNDGTFELKAREVPAFLEVYKWASALMDEKPIVEVKPVKKKKAKK